MARSRKSPVDAVLDIADEARRIAEALAPSVETDSKPTKKQLDAVRRLIRRSDEALDRVDEEARRRRGREIAQLQKLIADLDTALGITGLDAAVRRDLGDLRRRKRAALLRRQAKAATDFAGILSSRQVSQIEGALDRARREVAGKRRAAALISALIKIVDAALTVAARVAAL